MIATAMTWLGKLLGREGWPGAQSALAPRTMLQSSMFNASKVTLTMAITLPMGLVTKILLPRILGSEQAGVFFFAESFPLFLLGFMPMGVSAYIQKRVPPQHEHAWEIFTTVALFGAVVALLLVASLVAYLGWSDFDALTFRVTAIMACYQALMIFCIEFLQRFFLALGRYNYTSAMSIVAKVLAVAFVAVCLLASGSLEWVAASFLMAQVLVLVLMLLKAKNMGLTRSSFNAGTLRTILIVGLPFFFGGVLNSMNASIDSYCLLRLTSFRELGYYGAAQRLVSLSLVLTPILGQAFGPNLSHVYTHDREGYTAFISNLIRILILLATPLAMAFAAFGPEILHTLYGADFEPAKLAMMISGPLVLVSYLATFFAISAVTTTSGTSFSLILAFGAVINFTADYIFIKAGAAAFGPGGGAAGAALSSVLAMTVEIMLMVRTSGVKVVNKTTLHAIGVAMLPLAAFAFIANTWFAIGFVPRAAIFVLFVPGYFFVTRLMTRRDLALAKGLIREKLKR